MSSNEFKSFVSEGFVVMRRNYAKKLTIVNFICNP